MLWRLTNPNLPGWVDAPATRTPRGSNRARNRSGAMGPRASAGAHQRTSTRASTATGRPSTTSSGLRSAEAMSSRRAAASDRPTSTSATASAVDGRLAPERPEQGLEGQVVDHLLGVDPGDRHQPEADVGDGLGQDAAHPEHDGHAELRVVVQPGDQLAGRPQHRRHQQVDLAVLGRGRRQQRGGRVPHLRRPTRAPAARGPARSCGRWRRRPSLTTTGNPISAAASTASAAVDTTRSVGERHAERGEQLLRGRLGERGHGGSG